MLLKRHTHSHTHTHTHIHTLFIYLIYLQVKKDSLKNSINSPIFIIPHLRITILPNQLFSFLIVQCLGASHSQVEPVVKNPPANTGDIRDTEAGLDQEDLLEEGMTTHSLPGESHGQRSPGGYSPWGHKESDMTEAN